MWDEPQRLAAAAGLTSCAALAGFLLDPVVGDAGAYATFYPAVALAAFRLGQAQAVLVAATSAAIGHLCFDQPRWRAKAEPEALAALAFFLIAAAAMIWMASRMRRAVQEQASARNEAESLAQGHLALFREINERVTNHLQLVAGLLQLRARSDQGESMNRAFEAASSHSMLISRLHRDITGGSDHPLPFQPLARRLADAALAGRGSLRVEVVGSELRLPPDQATSAAVLLLEFIQARLDSEACGELQVKLGTHGGRARIEMVDPDGERAGRPAGLPLHFIEAMIEQLDGDYHRGLDEAGATTVLTFPLVRPPTDEHHPRVTLH